MGVLDGVDVPGRRPLRSRRARLTQQTQQAWPARQSRRAAWALAATEWLLRLGVRPDDVSPGSVGFAVVATLVLVVARRATALARALRRS